MAKPRRTGSRAKLKSLKPLIDVRALAGGISRGGDVSVEAGEQCIPPGYVPVEECERVRSGDFGRVAGRVNIKTRVGKTYKR